MTITREIVAARIREARENSQMTQDQLGKFVGLDRTVVAKIETNTRNVTGNELERFAHALGRNPQELLSTEPLKKDPLLLFRSIELDSAEHRQAIADCIALLREARFLERYLGIEEPKLPEGYRLPRLRTLNAAMKQGREIAQRERERLGLGHAPIPDMAELINAQNIRAAAVPFVEEVSGVFIRDEELGAAILVNEFSSGVRRRFSYAHEYAHALIDPDEPSEPSSRTNAGNLTEARANSFAGEFLVPEPGIWALLDRMTKGDSSRFHQALYSPAAEKILPLEGRNNTDASRITVREIAVLAHEFRVSSEVVIYRLLDIGAVRRPEKDELLTQRDNIRELLGSLRLYDADSPGTADQPYLRKQTIMLAIEALRRERISVGRFRDVCRLTGYPTDRLLDALGVFTEE